MSCTVFAENMGLFHKGSGGKGVAPGDVCLTPPPPPAGPVPVPYVNMLQASNLAKGSKSVKIQGEPTALESQSNVSTSNGNEPGSQPPKGVVTATNKGKGSFKLWSFTVKVEGKGVCRHGDMMGQNHMSDPPNCIDAAALTKFEAALKKLGVLDEPCPPYKRSSHAPKPDPQPEQIDAVNGKPCWECKKVNPKLQEAIWDTAKVTDASGANVYVKGVLKVEPKPNPRVHGRSNEAGAGMTHDHQPPMNVAWKMGGCHMPDPDGDPTGFQKHFGKAKAVKPHCSAHASSQGGTVRAYAADME
jgi:uncharacterized Zn-binding protein involved in type VI secretion